MIGISKLYCGQVEPSDALRYGRIPASSLPTCFSLRRQEAGGGPGT